jgi:hypothetical protein
VFNLFLRTIGQGFEILQSQSKPISGCKWLTPVMLVTREAEIRRLTVQGQPVSKTPDIKEGLTEWSKR